jgi:uncharacterized protein
MQARWLQARIAASRQNVLLLGPRQVGKSTLCRSLAPALYIDLADQQEFLGHARDPGRLTREVQALEGSALVVIDEIQRLPELLNTVQSLIDRHGKRLRFILTGSSARKLRRGGANLLPGRVVLEHLDPLTVLEILDEPGGRFDLDRALQLGMLPGIYLGDDDAEHVLGTYADTYLREEIQLEAVTRSVGSYARFLDVMAVTSGQWLNYAKLSSDSEIPKETFRRYVQILDDTLLAVRLPPFTPAAARSRRVSQRERVLLFDVGVRNALLGAHRRAVAQDQVGAVFEQWVLLQIAYLNRARRLGWRLSSYRSEHGAEVDLVVERADDIVGIEVKAGRTVSPRDTRGLASLGDVVGRRKPYRRWILYRGERRQRFADGTDAWPVLEGLRALADERPVTEWAR